MPSQKNHSAKTFWIVTALVLIVLTFVLIQFMRLWTALSLSTLIKNRAMGVSAEYLAITGGLWVGVGLLVFLRLARREKTALLSLQLIAVGFSVNYWVEQLWLTRSELRSLNWIFSAGLNFLFLLILFIVSSHPFVRNIFGDRNGRK